MINQNNPDQTGIYINIGFKKIQSNWGLKQAIKSLGSFLSDNFITRLPAHLFIYFQAMKIVKAPSTAVKETYEKLKQAYEADKTLKKLEAQGNVQDRLLTSARKALLDLAFYMRQAKQNSEQGENQLKADYAELLLECIEWKSKDQSDKSYENIRRVYRGSHKITDQSNNILDEETAKEYEKKFDAMFSEMHEAFYDFRKEVVAHQNSLFRAAGGLFNDKKVLNCHERVMNIFRRFTDDQNHPDNVEMLKKLIPSQNNSNVQALAK